MKSFDVTLESITVTYHGLGETVEIYDDLDELQASMAEAAHLHVLLDVLLKRAAEFVGMPKLTDKLKELAERIVAENVAKGLEDRPIILFPFTGAAAQPPAKIQSITVPITQAQTLMPGGVLKLNIEIE